MSKPSVKTIKVSLNFDNSFITVGLLAYRNRQIYFEYDPKFIQTNLSISPFYLPLEPGLKTFDKKIFDGLPGVFNDSLPDGWGRLLLDRFLKTKGINPLQLTPLDRLMYVGYTGIGAFVYEPHSHEDKSHLDRSHVDSVNLDDLSQQTKQILVGSADEVLQNLLTLNSSSSGARPKAMIGIHSSDSNSIIYGHHQLPENFTYWLVKFPNVQDGTDAGAIEYVYSLMAKKAGVNITNTRLLSAKHSAGYFAIQRFDRKVFDNNQTKRLHVHTASGLLHSDFRIPSLDYKELLALTESLTQDMREVEKMYRLAVFNVIAHNRDDHGKNFSFLMNPEGEWSLSPAYDLTFSTGPGGEHSTTVVGEGKNPTKEHLRELGKKANIKGQTIDCIIEQTQQAVQEWPTLAKKYGVSSSNIQMIHQSIV